MGQIPLGKTVWDRRVAREAPVILKNRFFETNPVLSETQVALIARPGRRKLVNVGAGPIRGVYSSNGSFDNALFVVSQDSLYRVDVQKVVVPGKGIVFDAVPTLIGQINGYYAGGTVSFAATATIGDGLNAIPAYLYIADGQALWCYTDNGYAQAKLTASAIPNDNDTVQIGTVYYKFTSGSVDAGTPDGTSANPWLVAIGVSLPAALQNLYNAIDNSGNSGVQYSTALVAAPNVARVSLSADELVIRSTLIGVQGNSTVVAETSSVLAWNAGTLGGGGTPSLYQIPTPDDLGVVSLAFVKSFVVVVPVQGGVNGQYNGRFYWINPGENNIDPLNFATAERAPDPIWQVFSFNDKVWFTGASTIEPWYPTGDPTVPFRPFAGVTFERGAISGTALQVRDSMLFVDPDGGVFEVNGGIKRVSTPAVEELIKKSVMKSTYLQEIAR